MAGTVNPNFGTLAALLPQNGYKPESGVGGIQAGIQLADYLEAMDRTQRMDDLTYKSESNKLDNEMANNPILELERKLKMSQLQGEQALEDSGLKQQGREADIQMKLETLQQTSGDTVVKAVTNQATLAEHYMNLEEQGQMTDNMRQQYQAQFRRLGLNVDLMSGNPKSKIQLARMALIAPSARKFAEAQALSAQGHGQAMQRDQINNEQAMARAELQARATRELASSRNTESKNPADRALNEISNKPVITSDDLNRVTWALEAKERISIKFDPAMEALRGSWRNQYANTDKKDQKKLGATMQEYVDKKEEEVVTRKTNAQLANYLSGKQIEIGGKMVTIKPGNIDAIVKKIKEADAGKDEMPKDPDPAAEKLKALNEAVTNLKKEMKGMTLDEQRAYANKKIESIPNRQMAKDIHDALAPHFIEAKKAMTSGQTFEAGLDEWTERDRKKRELKAIEDQKEDAAITDPYRRAIRDASVKGLTQ